MNRPRIRTLGIVGVCLAVLAAGTVVGVEAYDSRGSVTLLANWSGRDAEQFRNLVLRPFEEEHDIDVVYQGSSAESQVLAADVRAGTPPDVVILPGTGELAEYAERGQLRPLDGLVDADDFGTTWMPRVKGADQRKRHYWAPVKADLKSIVWHHPDVAGERLEAAAADPDTWCLGMGSGATSGWPGTDWIEDILLQQAGWEMYQNWATGRLSWRHPDVRRAWETWGELVGAKDPERVRWALTTSFTNASKGVTEKPPTCLLEHQASFIRNSPQWQEAPGGFVHSAALVPGASEGTATRAWEVSGDMAAMLNGTPQAEKLIRYLASPETQRRWARAQSAFSANRTVLDAYAADTVSGEITRALRDRDQVHCFDASDAMPLGMREAFTQAVLRFLADPADLDKLLATLEEVRTHTEDRWLPSVCDHRPGGDAPRGHS